MDCKIYNNYLILFRMKKKLILSVIVATISTVSAISFEGQNSKDNDLFVSNIEALSKEGEGSEVVKCYCKIHWFSPNICSANANGSYCGGNPCSNHDGNCR